MTNSLTVAKVFSKTFIAIQIFLQKLSIYLPHFKTEILTSRWLTNSLSFEEMGPDFRKILTIRHNCLYRTFFLNAFQ